MRVPPLGWMTASLACGILAAPLVPTGAMAPLWLFVAISLLVLLALRRNAALACWTLPFLVIGIASAHLRSTPLANDISRGTRTKTVTVIGTVAAEPEPGARGSAHYPLAVRQAENDTRVTGTLWCTQGNRAGPEPRIGDSIAVSGTIELPRNMTNPGGFDYRAYLGRRGVFAVLRASRPGTVRIIAPATGFSLLRTAADLRRILLASLAASPLPPDSRALLGGMLLGERDGIPVTMQNALERTGAVHILSVSGLHLAVIATALAYFARLLPPRRDLRIGANLMALVLIWLFALVAGLAAATVRSAVMTTLLLLSPVFRRDARPLHSLLVAAFLLLLIDPMALYDVGAQLSFCCVAALILWVTPLAHWLLPLDRTIAWPMRRLRGGILLLLAGGVATVASAPLTAYHFSFVSLIGPLAGIVLVPLAEMTLLAGLLTVGSAAAGLAPNLLWQPVGISCRALESASLFFAAPERAAIAVPQPPLGGMIGFYLLFTLLGGWFARRVLLRTFFPAARPRPKVRELVAVPLAGLILLPLAIIGLPIVTLHRERLASGRVRVTFLDVGQGDSAVIETPDGAVAVIDGGGYPGTNERFGGDPGNRTVVPFLRRRGIDTVDWLVPTHPDEDHVQGLIGVALHLPVRHVLDGGVPDDGHDACFRLRSLLRDRRVPVVRALRGATIALGNRGVVLEVLHPGARLLRGTRSDTNANSIVLRLRYGTAGILFTGDADMAAEEEMQDNGAIVRADVLKVGHHGSRFSSGMRFLRAVQPRAAILSVGADNPFGHPAPELQERLRAVDATPYRTDRQGAIVVETDGRKVFVSPVLPLSRAGGEGEEPAY